jgi:hypothetical protein
MPTLDTHQSSQYTKVILIGDSGTGKTGSLVSLLEAGYHFKILDLDNGLDSLVHYARERCPDKLANVEFETIRDEYRSTKAGPMIRGQPTAFVSALDPLTRWSEIEDPNTIFVLDSFSAFGRAAFEWAKGMNPMAKDPRQWYFSAQQGLESTLAMLTGEQFKMNVILISHVNYKEIVEGQFKGYPNAVGSALGPTVAKYFNTLLLAETSGSGTNVKRKIKTMPTGVIDLKCPNPAVEKELPLETALATIFSQLKGTKP